MFKILQARLQQYMNHEIPYVEAGFNKGRGTKNQISNMCGVIKVTRELQEGVGGEGSISSSLFMPKLLTVLIKTNCGKFLKRWEYPTTLPASWETCMQVKKQQIEQGMEQWTDSKLGKKYFKAVCILSPYLFNFHSEYIMWNVGLDEAQAGTKTARRNINNLRYAYDTTLMAEI